MNIIEICGGLGNQLFQYALGRAQMENGIRVKYDLSWYKRREKKHPRSYQLDKFHVNVKIGSFTASRNKKFFREKGFDLSLLKKDNCNFKGYWQYFAYYADILPILKKEFRVKEEFHTKKFLNLKEKVINNNPTSIHVRRTDYISEKGLCFGYLPFRYYFNAITEKIKGDLFIFSDDMQWCKEHFKQDYFLQKITFVHLKDYLDFELMRLCNNNIIANSSFSWWPACLNDNPEKIVVVPRQKTQWLADTSLDAKERYNKNWIKM